MKKYMIPVAALLLASGMVNAQSTPKKSGTDKPVAKMSKPATKKGATTTAAVSPSTSTPVKKTKPDVAIKRKHPYKKGKSVKPAGS